MASAETLLAVVLLAVVAASAPSAQAQLLGTGMLRINGTVHCSAGPVTATTAVFPNAAVQLRCGNNVVQTTTTNSNGVFNMQLSYITSLLSTLLSQCKLVVTTPLSTCDLSLPTSGHLESNLQLLDGGGLGGLIGVIIGLITNLIPRLFSFVR